MKTSLKAGLRSGIVIGIVFIFLMLIGFINVGAGMIGDFLDNLDQVSAAAPQPVVNLLIITAIFGIITGFSARNKTGESRWYEAVLSGFVGGVIGGLIIGGAIWLTGNLHVQGVDFRSYLPNLSPDTIRYLLFYSAPPAAAITYFAYLTIFSALTAMLVWLLSINNWFARRWQSARESTAAWVSSHKLASVAQNRWVVVAGFALLAALLYVLPLIWGSYWNYIMGTVAIYILLGLGLNIIVGYSGQLVLGYVAFFATGAYTFALLTAPEPHGIGMALWLAVLLAVLVSTLTGLLLGLPILNLRGDYLAIVTLGFGEIVRILIKSDLLTDITNGPKGVTSVGQPTLFGNVFTDINYMHLLTILVLVGLFVAKRLRDSRTGRSWIAIREDQTVAQATGINTYRSKILALLLGAAFAGLAGALFASRNQFTGPEDFTLMVSVNVLCIVIVGGMGSLPGIVIGAFVLKGLPELLRDLADYRLLAFGALLVVMMIVRPEGLWPAPRTQLEHPGSRQTDNKNMEVQG